MYTLAEDVSFPTITEIKNFGYGNGYGAVMWATNDNTGSVFTDYGIDNQVYNTTGGDPTIKIAGIDVAGFNAPASTFYQGVNGFTIDNSFDKSLDKTTIDIGKININLTGSGNAVLTGFKYINGSSEKAFDGTLKIGDVNVANTDNEVLGVDFGPWGSSDIVGKVTVGNITATTTKNGPATGFGANDIINGAEVQIGNIDVASAGTYGTGATGIDASSIAEGGSLKAGNVTVTATGEQYASATGIDANSIVEDGSLNVGNVTVTATGEQYANATGISTSSIADGGSLKAGDVTVTATGEDAYAVGINLYGVLAANNKFDVGTIKVNSTANTGYTYGIDAYGYDGDITLTITKDVIATTSGKSTDGAAAYGISVDSDGGNSNLTINTDAGDVQISGTTGDNVVRSINLDSGTNDTLTITGKNKHLNKGAEFTVVGADKVRWETDADYVDGSLFLTNATTTHQVATGKTAVINGLVFTNNNAYSVGSNADNESAGTLVLQQLAAGNVTVNNGMLALDGTKNHQIGALTIGNDNPDANAQAAVALYGNTAAGNLALAVADPTLKANALVDPVTKEKILSVSTISEYKWFGVDADHGVAGYYSGNRKRASLSDGFLLPASVHNRTTAWEATRDHLISGSRQTKFSKEFLGQSPCEPCEPVSCDPCEPISCDPCDPCNSGNAPAKRSAWVNYVGRSNNYRSSYSNIGIANGDWEIGTDGVQVGLDLYKTRKAQLGLLFGYEGSVAKLRADRLEADDVYVGAYAAYVFSNGADFRAIYNYGSQDYKLTRLDPGLGLNWHSHNAAFDGNTNEVNLELGKRIFVNRRWSYRPVIGFDLLINDWDGALEDGNLSTAIAYNGTDYTQAFLRVGTDLKYVKGGFELNSGLYYSYDLNDNELKSKVFARDNSKLGYDKDISSTLFGSDLGRSVLTFNVGGSFACSERLSIFGGFTGDAVLDRDGKGFQSIGYVGTKLNW
jgi:hypothetical protein